MGKGDNLQEGVSTDPGETLGTSSPSQPSEDEILLQNVKVDEEKVNPEADYKDRSASESCGNGKESRKSGDFLSEMESQDDVEKNVLSLKSWLWKHKFWIIIGMVVAIFLIGASVGICRYYLAKPSEPNGWTESWTELPETSGRQSWTTSPPEPIDLPCGRELVLNRWEKLVLNRTTLYIDHKLLQPALAQECGIRLNNSLLTVDLPARCNGILTCLDQSLFCYEAKGGYIKNITCVSWQL